MQVFMPYVYVPSTDATYVKLVTPLGELHVETDVLWKAFVSVAVLLVTLLLYRLCFASGKTKRTKRTKKGKKEPKLQKSGDVRDKQEGVESSSEDESDDEDGDDDGRSALDESILKKGEHSYYYAHQRRVVKDDAKDESAIKKTMVSTYGWVDNKSTVRYVNSYAFLLSVAVEACIDCELTLCVSLV